MSLGSSFTACKAAAIASGYFFSAVSRMLIAINASRSSGLVLSAACHIASEAGMLPAFM